MRKHYLDNIRWAAVGLVLVYHVFYLFNASGVPGGISGAPNIPLCDTLACVVYPWFMVLLFVTAGISARYSLEKRTAGQFLRERARRLLVPSTLGLFVVHWITGYLNLKMSGTLETIPLPLRYPIAAVSGIGPLWFIQMLFLFSCFLILIRIADRRDRIWSLCGKVNFGILLSLFLVLYGGAQILNLPVFTMYRFGIYFAAYLTGYFVFSQEHVWALLERAALPLLCCAIPGAVLFGLRWGGSDFTSDACLRSLGTNLYLWIAVLAVLGCGKRFLDFETPVTRYLARAGFGLYLLHYPVLTAAGYLLCVRCSLPPFVTYGAALAIELSVTLGLYELLRRIPFVRYAVLGISKRRAP